MKIERFEDIVAWQEARSLVNMIYSMTKDGKISRDYRFCNQIQSAAVSTMSNISEGFARRYNKEFSQFLFISIGSCAEVQSHLYVALDQGYINEEKFQEIYAQATKVAKLISGFITYLLESERKTKLNKLNKPDKLNKPNKGGKEWNNTL